MQTIRNGYDSICKQLEKNTRLTELGFYGVSASVLIYACYKKKPFSRFVRARDIPNEFVAQKIQQRALIKKIEGTKDGILLQVSHRPPLSFLSFSRKTLPVKISGISVDTNGLTWLETISSKSKEIRFVPFTNTSDKHVDAQVFLIDPKNDGKSIDLAKALLSIGFASKTAIPPTINLKVDSYAKSYYKDLETKEKIAKFFRRGRWSNESDQFQLRRKLELLLFAIKTQERKVPALVRSGIKKVLKSNTKKLMPATA